METFVIRDEVFVRMRRALGPTFTNKIVSEFGTIAVNFSKERFVKKNWINETAEAWTPRKRKARGSLLVKTARLKRSIRKISSGDGYVIIGSDVPYAKIHNEGGTISKTATVKAHDRKRTVRTVSSKTGKKLKRRVDTGDISRVKAHTRKMNLTIPKRQFMGESKELENRTRSHLRLRVDQILNQNP
ncbi:phage virion morphogenesis protein [Epilithonimonas mollis]|uniref:Phage virion morphogenesis family protein n=1 Tax=Epilithonimonas mollis TaxID=216903 RepID=A0A1M6UK57_9FLAO|nr:phage virion morphogenesis protein [Epilithonimonas mollis]SHK69561.1 Phage virion morphogenesis family protein [Epilithonimonas mollis]